MIRRVARGDEWVMPRAAAALAWLAIATTAAARDDDVSEEAATPRAVPGPQGVAIAGPRVLEYDLGKMFDSAVFGRAMGGPQMVVQVAGVTGPTAMAAAPVASTLSMLEPVRLGGEARIAVIDRLCGLSADQRHTLELALESDVRRLADHVEAVRADYAGVRLTATQQDPERLQRFNSLQRAAADCRRRIARVFGPDSLLATVGVQVLDPEQAAAVVAWRDGRRDCRWRAMVATVLSSLDDTVLGLSARQYAALEDRLLADVPPLAVFPQPPSGRGTVTDHARAFQSVLVTARLGRHAAEIRPLLDERQWRELEAKINQAGDPAVVEAMLVERGVLEERGP